MSRYPELGEAFSAIHSNLDRLDRHMERLLECSLAHWEEWAQASAHSGEARDALLQLLDSLHPDRDVSLPADVPAENREALRDFYRHMSTPTRLALLRAMLDHRSNVATVESADPLELSERAADKIAYVKNAFSDNAYLQFSAELTHPRAANFDSFSDVCEEVYNGICEFGILPILHERDGKLFRFYTLLEKYELRIVCACDVPCVEQNGVTSTRYALIRKALPAGGTQSASHIELLLPTNGGALSDLLLAAQSCGLTPIRVDTRAASEGDAETYQITLRHHSGNLPLFLTFVSLCLPDCTVLGLYRVLAD